MEKLSNLKWYLALPIWYAIMTTLTFIIWFGLSQAMGGPEDVFTNPVTCLKFSSLMAIPFTAITLLTINMSNSSQKFWDRAEEVSERIEAAETTKELHEIINDEFIKGGTLRRLSGGGPHYEKMKQMIAIIKTKLKYVK
jgi:hypothetical protein